MAKSGDFVVRKSIKMNSQKNNYLFVLKFIAVLFLLGCEPKLGNEDIDVDTLCSEPRPEVCTREYAPVCAYELDRAITYSNGCAACREKEIIGYKYGECL